MNGAANYNTKLDYKNTWPATYTFINMIKWEGEMKIYYILKHYSWFLVKEILCDQIAK